MKVFCRRTASDKVLHNKVFTIPSDSKFDGYQRGHALVVYKFPDKNYADTVGDAIKKDNIKVPQIISKRVTQANY